jgi:hypothetical protein
MTAHSGFPWKQGEPVTDALVTEVATCTQFNLTGLGFTPPVYGILSAVDGLIYNMGQVLDTWDREKDFAEHVKTFGAPDWFVEIAVGVLPQIKFPEKRKPCPNKITVPKVNREYPKL